MKKLVWLVTFMTMGVAFAQDAQFYKNAALKSCESAVEHLTGDAKNSVLHSCQCTVEKTDYDEVMKAQSTGDYEKVQQLALAAAEKCAKEKG